MMWTDDPIRDWDRYCEEQDAILETYPKCDHCGERITDVVYEIGNELFCGDCITKLFARDAEEMRGL